MFRARIALVWIALLVACSGEAGNQGEPDPRSGPPCPTSIDEVASQVFELSCVDAGCHGSNDRAAGLDLQASALELELFGKEAALCGGEVRVVPGDAASSYLIDKLRGTGCGAQMPIGVPLPNETIDCIAAWIDGLDPVGACETCGVGELCITVAFGLLPVCGAAWLQSAVVDWRSVLVAVPVGLWVTLILLINEVPDRNADAASGKRTLAVRLGIDGTRKLYLALHLAAFGCVLALSATGLMPWWIAAGAAVILAGGVRASKGIGDPVTGRGALTKSIEMTLGLQAAGSILLLLGALFSNA